MAWRELRARSRRFCTDCGERITSENRAPYGGARCGGCRALVNPRPGVVSALVLASIASIGFALGRATSHVTLEPPPTLVIERIPPTSVATPPAISPSPRGDVAMHECGARTKKGTLCKRLVRGPGHCWQHGGSATSDRPWSGGS